MYLHWPHLLRIRVGAIDKIGFGRLRHGFSRIEVFSFSLRCSIASEFQIGITCSSPTGWHASSLQSPFWIQTVSDACDFSRLYLNYLLYFDCFHLTEDFLSFWFRPVLVLWFRQSTLFRWVSLNLVWAARAFSVPVCWYKRRGCVIKILEYLKVPKNCYTNFRHLSFVSSFYNLYMISYEKKISKFLLVLLTIKITP